MTRLSQVDQPKLDDAGPFGAPHLVRLAIALIIATLFLGPQPLGGGDLGSVRGPFEPPPATPMGARDPFSYVEPTSVIATVVTAEVIARTSPDEDADAIATFSQVTSDGAPQVFLLTVPPGSDPEIRAGDGIWYEALLPVRPNGTIGFLPADAVTLSTTPYRIVVNRAAFELTLWEGSDIVERMPIGLGTGQTPTPVGDFYLTSLLRPPEPDGIYGPFAYGLSGFSEVLTDWVGGGVVGLHGTNDPASIGKLSSHGCIRLRNEDIEALVPLLALGTPVQIL